MLSELKVLESGAVTTVMCKGKAEELLNLMLI